MKYIKLTRGHTAIVDDEDADLGTMKWWALVLPKRRLVYATRKVMRQTKVTTYLLHRVILERMLERSMVRGEEVDHKDGDGLNNRRSNLRLATRGQNAANMGKTRKNSSGYKGVTWHRTKKRWRAQTNFMGHHITIGDYKEIMDAARAYDEKTLELRGGFAYLNFPRRIA